MLGDERVLTVYPRACGGTLAPNSRVWPLKGLSPRVRGNQAGRLRLTLR